MYSYFLNWMGPVSTKWYFDNNIPYSTEEKYSELLNKEIIVTNWEKYYSTGRIDIDYFGDDPDKFLPYGEEVGVPMMCSQSWSRLGTWLKTLKTSEMLSLEEILQRYYSEGGEIEWFEEKK